MPVVAVEGMVLMEGSALVGIRRLEYVLLLTRDIMQHIVATVVEPSW